MLHNNNGDIMNKDSYNEGLFKFIEKATCSFTCVSEIKKLLLNSGYTELCEGDKWDINVGKYFVIRNDSSIIAFNIGNNYRDSFNIICSHGDTPGFSLKPNSDIYEYDYLKLNVTPYGGILNYGWMDRPLGITGRVIYKDEDMYKKRIINLDEPKCVIPSEAIHQNDTANSNLDLNSQIDMIPIISFTDNKNIVNDILSKYVENKYICDYDLFLYSMDKPMYVGVNNEMILSPRIDDLTCTYANVLSFVESNNDNNINVLCIFNSEEVGSLTMEGADSSFLMDILKRICAFLEIDISTSLYNSYVVSADNFHAVHPNHPNKSDVSNMGYINKGILISRESGTMTDGMSSSIFKEICKNSNVNYQDYVSRNDMTCGGTLSGLCTRHVSTTSIDVGIPQLAMHSANEVVGSTDTYDIYRVFKKFYGTSIRKDTDGFKLIYK